MKREPFIPYRDENDPNGIVHERIVQLNRLLIEAQELAAARGLAIGWSRNCVGQLSYDTAPDALYEEFGWTPSSICE